MNTDIIDEVGIDSEERLYVKPASKEFAHIYRAACGVSWDESKRILFSPNPDKWSYAKWFEQIIYGVRSEYGDMLLLSEKTKWINVDENLINEIKQIRFK